MPRRTPAARQARTLPCASDTWHPPVHFLSVSCFPAYDWCRSGPMIVRFLLTASIRIFSVLYEIFPSILTRAPSETDRLRVRLKRELETAANYDDWRVTARRLDELNGFGEWREQSNEYFDAELARQRLEALKALRAADNVRGLMHHLRADLHRGIGGVWNPKMHLYQTGSKRFIEEYLEHVEQMLHHLLRHPEISPKDKDTFFTDLSAAYGQSALVLSGAAALGIYHIGTVQALYQQNLLPRIISGTNTGAIVAAIVCTHHDHELLKLAEFEATEDGITFDAFKKRDKIGDTIGRRLRRFLDQGVLMDVTVLKEFLRSNIGDMTFIESYWKVGGGRSGRWAAEKFRNKLQRGDRREATVCAKLPYTPVVTPPPPLLAIPHPLGGGTVIWPKSIENTRRRRRQRKMADSHCDTMVQFCGATPPPPRGGEPILHGFPPLGGGEGSSGWGQGGHWRIKADGQNCGDKGNYLGTVSKSCGSPRM